MSIKVHFTPEQEAQLSEIANHAGTDAERLVKDAASRLIQQDAAFAVAVERGEEALERGEYLTHDQMGEHLQRLFRS